MALFFSGFVFFRNLLAPSESRLSFRKIRIEKIDLIRLFLWEGKRQGLTPCTVHSDPVHALGDPKPEQANLSRLFLIAFCLPFLYLVPDGTAHAAITDCRLEGGTQECIAPLFSPWQYANTQGSCPARPFQNYFSTETEAISEAVANAVCYYDACTESHTVGTTWLTGSSYLGLSRDEKRLPGLTINLTYSRASNPACGYNTVQNPSIGRFRTVYCPAGYIAADSPAENYCYRIHIEPPCPETKGNPTCTETGRKVQVERDVVGTGLNTLSFERVYSSYSFSSLPQVERPSTSFGFFWRSNYERYVALYKGQIKTTAVVFRQNGTSEYFYLSGGQWYGRADQTSTLSGALDVNGNPTGWVYGTRDGEIETYDASGRLLTIQNRSGVIQSLTYDSSGKLLSVSNSFGHTFSFNYDGFDRLVSLTDASGLTAYRYDANNNLIEVSYPDGTARIYHYEKAALRNHLTGISIRSVAGTVTRYSTYDYDSRGQAISSEHAGGQGKFSFQIYSNTTYVTDAVGSQEGMTFATNLGVNNLVSKTNFTDNKTLTQTFDTNNNLTCKKDEEGRVTTYTYNASNQKASQTEGQGGTCSAPVSTAVTRTTTYQYLTPALDLPVLIETPSVFIGSKKRVAIGYTGNLPTSIMQSGFTPSGAAVSRSVTMTYNTSGQVTSINGPRTDVADVTTLVYNVCTTGGGCGQLQRATNALGQVTTYDSYDANGRLLQMTDPNGVRTVYSYDPRGRVLSFSQIAPGGTSRVTSYGYDAAGNVTSTSLPNGLSLTYTYDAAQYLRRVTDSLGYYIDYGYDLKGNRTQTYTYDATNTLVRSVDMAFDARNRVSQINAGGSITKQIADAVGNLTKVTDPNTVAAAGSAATNNSYDALNRLFQTVDRLSGSTFYNYDTNDRLKTVQAPNGASTQYQYDDLGNLLKEISPDRGTVSYAYDAAGNLTQQTDARGVVSTYAYDVLNRLLSINYGSSTENVTYAYDSNTNCTFGLGRLCAVVDESGGTAYGYDAFGNMLVQTHTELGITYNTFYTYDAGNRVTSITYPDGRVVSTPRDVLGRITSVATSVNGTAVTIAGNRSFRPDGLLLGQTFGNGVNELRTYDTQGRLTYQSLASADTRLYAYDANGNLKGLQSLPLVGSYNYDALDRLSLDQRTTTATASSTFTYDANGNRKSENLGSYAYLANSNRLQSTPQGSIVLDAAGNTTSDGTRSYTYNNAGHLGTVAGAGYSYNAQRLRSRKIVGSQGTVYHYDLSGNLIAESDTAGVLRRSYVWADGQPLAQVETVTTLPPDIIVDNPQATFTGTWPTATSLTGFYGANYRSNTKGTGKDKATWSFNVPTTGTYQVYARWVAASTHASNAPFTVKYSTGSQTLAVNQRASGGQWMLLGSYAFTAGTAGSVTVTDNANGTVIADAVKLVATSGGTTSEAVRYLHADHLNTPRLATNQQAQVVWRWDGSAFGDTQPTGTVTINLRFPGQYYDAESGLHYNWNRYYDPKVGRYVTSDPIGLTAGLNTYAYVYDNPLRWTDRLGLMGSGGYIYRPIICNGEWVAVAWERSAINPFGIQLCICYWRCKECKNPSAWSGNKYDLPSTTNFMIFDGSRRPGGGDGDIETGNSCLCTRKPGPEKKDQCCDK